MQAEHQMFVTALFFNDRLDWLRFCIFNLQCCVPGRMKTVFKQEAALQTTGQRRDPDKEVLGSYGFTMSFWFWVDLTEISSNHVMSRDHHGNEMFGREVSSVKEH